MKHKKIFLNSLLIWTTIITSCLSSCKNDTPAEPVVEKELEVIYPNFSIETIALGDAMLNLTNPLTGYLFSSRNADNQNFIYSPFMVLKMLSLLSTTTSENEYVNIYNEFNRAVWPTGRGICYVDSIVLKDYVQEINNYISSKNGYLKFATGGAIWTNPGTELLISQDWKNSYKVSSQFANLKDSNTTDEINGWYNQFLYSSGENLLNASTRLSNDLLWTDVMKIEGLFTYSFDANKTRKENFICSDGSIHEVEMMHASQPLSYSKDEETGIEKIAFPFGQFSKYELIITLPPVGMSIEEVLDHDRLWSLLEYCNPRYSIVDIRLPKFRVEETTYDIAESLVKAGLKTLFSESTSYPKIARDIKNLQYIQGCSLDITEEKGIKGETGKNIEWYKEGETHHVSMTVNRPFLFSIYCPSSYFPILVGVINDPEL